MKRYFREVRALDKGHASVMDVVRALCPDRPDDWASILTAGRLYLEDGGQRLTLADFEAAAEAAANPTPQEVLGHVWEW